MKAAKFLTGLKWALWAAPVLLAAILFAGLPESIPIHWDAAGELTRSGSRWELWLIPPLFLLPALLLDGLLRLLKNHFPPGKPLFFSICRCVAAAGFAAPAVGNLIFLFTQAVWCRALQF